MPYQLRYAREARIRAVLSLYKAFASTTEPPVRRAT